MLNINAGLADRIIRIVVGTVMLSLFFMYPDAWWRYLTLIGFVPLITGLFGSCPFYSFMGLSTCPKKKS